MVGVPFSWVVVVRGVAVVIAVIQGVAVVAAVV